MTTINRSKIVPYTKTQMYNLVNDVEDYNKFIPFCVNSKVISKETHELRATLDFAKGGIEKSFTTLNRLHPHKMIEIRLVDGPFKHLEGFWRFEDMGDGHCKVSLDMNFEFSSRLVGMMFGAFFQQIAGSLVDAFCDHAKEVYGDQD